jgi:hypothetical protein
MPDLEMDELASGGGDSFAVKMFKSIPLVIERKPALVNWKPALSLDHTWPASPNKAGMAACLEMVDSWNNGDFKQVGNCLEWFQWLDSEPFMLNEAGTGEDIYLGGHAYPVDIAACIADEMDNSMAMLAAQRLGRSHIGLCLMGLAPGPGKFVVDKNGDGTAQTVLVGTGKPKRDMDYVVRPGGRTWVRSGKKVGDPFTYTENYGAAGLVRIGLGRPLPTKKGILDTERAIWNARRKRWPVAQHPAFGLYGNDLFAAIDYSQDVTSVHKARAVVKWIKRMEQDFKFWRFVTGEVIGGMTDSRRSSTDQRTLDAWYLGGETRKTSPEDGIRSTYKPTRVWWEQQAVATQFVDGSGKVLRLPHPHAALAFCAVLDSDRDAYIDANDDFHSTPATPDDDIPSPPAPAPKSKPRDGWGF